MQSRVHTFSKRQTDKQAAYLSVAVKKVSSLSVQQRLAQGKAEGQHGPGRKRRMAGRVRTGTETGRAAALVST